MCSMDALFISVLARKRQGSKAQSSLSSTGCLAGVRCLWPRSNRGSSKVELSIEGCIPSKSRQSRSDEPRDVKDAFSFTVFVSRVFCSALIWTGLMACGTLDASVALWTVALSAISVFASKHFEVWRRSWAAKTNSFAKDQESLPGQSLRQWWPDVSIGSYEEPSFANITPFSQRAAQVILPARQVSFEGDAVELLRNIMDVVDACRTGRSSHNSGRFASNLNIQCVVNEPARRVFMAHHKDCPTGFVCSQVELSTSVPVEAALWALYSVEERLLWDSASYRTYEVIQPGSVQKSSKAVGDFVYCKVPAPPGMCDRDVVQERFLLRTGEGRYAIVMHSCSEATAALLGRPASKNAVRATTILSGYLLHASPVGKGVVLTAMSQTDFGSNVPHWIQGMAKKAGTSKVLEWAQRLEEHCNIRARNAASPYVPANIYLID